MKVSLPWCTMHEGDEVAWSRKCACGKSFYQPNSFSNHIRSCARYKGGVGATLESARAKFAQRKKSKKGKEAIESWYGDGEDALDVDQDLTRTDVDRSPSPVPEPPAPVLPPLGRGMRVRAPPKAYQDFLATSVIPFEIPMSGLAIESPPASPPLPPTPAPSQREEQRRTVLLHSQWKASRPNGFDVHKSYWTLESRPHDPDLFLCHTDLWEDEDDRLATLSQAQRPSPDIRNPYHPFPNWSSYCLGEWYWSEGGDKSRESFQRLVDVISSDDFSPADVRNTNWKRVDAALASSEFDDAFGDENSLWAEDGTSWKTTSVTVDVPFNSTSIQPGSKAFTIENYRFRPLVPLIRAKLQDAHASEHFHILPSELWWKGKDGQDKIRVYGDLYHSDAFLEAYRAIQLLPPEPEEDDLPRYVVALMFASDDTMLASFGDAKLWPVYGQFGNESKYRRSRTTLQLMEEVAYLRSIPDTFYDWYLKESGKNTVGDDVLKHVRRELFHAQWRVLLDDEFLHAYEHGLVVDCPDRQRRRFYPRVLTYSADYPERVKLVGIRNIGECPCPRCLVSLADAPQLGTWSDRQTRVSLARKDDPSRRDAINQARKYIYKDHYAVSAAIVEASLKPTSLVAASNAFSDALSSLDFDMHEMVAVDILHEVELGVWKSLFIHLLRLLEAAGVGKTDILNSRFRQIPSFGRDTIRRFSHNVSAMKQLGGRDFEDLLQCSVPAFEGLFPGEHDGRVQDLLFAMAHWHALAKLRMHTDASLEILDQWTSTLGERSRSFIKLTCSRFPTKELKREYEARKRKEASHVKEPRSRAGKQTQSSETAGPSASADTSRIPSHPRRRPRTWNISTPKFHALGDVVPYIRRFGTTDSYSTQLSERYHRFPKARYRRTNKKDVTRQFAQIHTRQVRIKKLHRQLHPSREELDPSHPWTLPNSGRPTPFIGKSQNQPVNLPHFLRLNAADPATQGFLDRLKLHLFPKILAALIEEVEADPTQYSDAVLPTLLATASSEPSEEDLNQIYFHSDTIYRHNVLKIPYTTYDCRQDSDTVNPNTSRRDIMCLRDHDALNENDPIVERQEHEDPVYVYGRVLGIFHANIVYGGTGALDYRRRRFDFLWVRWFIPISLGSEDLWSSGQLDRVKLATITQAGACGFVGPADVLRAAHIVPRFSLGLLYEDETDKKRKKRKKGGAQGEEAGPQPIQLFSKCAQDEKDWREYYINRFADRDMVMRFHRGIAVGHSHSLGISPQSQSQSGVQDVPMDVGRPVAENEGPSGTVTEVRPSASGGDEDQVTDDDKTEDGDDLSVLEDGEGEENTDEDDFYATEPDSEEDPDFYE